MTGKPDFVATIMADTPSLEDAAQQSMLTFSLRMGDSCLRQMDVPCTQKPGLTLCR